MENRDILAVTRSLEGTGMERPKAEAVVRAINTTVRDSQAELVTKADMALLPSDLRSEMSLLRADMIGAMSSLEARLSWRLSGAMLAFAGLSIAIQRLMG